MVERIRALARNKGLSLTALEEKLFFGNGTIGKWSKQSPSSDKLLKVANYLETSVDYLLTGKEKAPSLSEDAQELLNIYTDLSIKGRAVVLAKAVEEQRAEQAAAETAKQISAEA